MRDAGVRLEEDEARRREARRPSAEPVSRRSPRDRRRRSSRRRGRPPRRRAPGATRSQRGAAADRFDSRRRATVSNASAAERLPASHSTKPAPASASRPRRHRKTLSSPPSPSSHSGLRYSSAVMSRPFSPALSTWRTYRAPPPGYTVHIALERDSTRPGSPPNAPSSATSVSHLRIASGRRVHREAPSAARSRPSNHPTRSPRTLLMVYDAAAPVRPPARTPGVSAPASCARLISSRSSRVASGVANPSTTTTWSRSSLRWISSTASSWSHHHSDLPRSAYFARRKKSASAPSPASWLDDSAPSRGERTGPSRPSIVRDARLSAAASDRSPRAPAVRPRRPMRSARWRADDGTATTEDVLERRISLGAVGVRRKTAVCFRTRVLQNHGAPARDVRLLFGNGASRGGDASAAFSSMSSQRPGARSGRRRASSSPARSLRVGRSSS